MFAWLVRIIVIFGLLTLIYVGLSRYQRWEVRRKLEAEYDAAPDHEEERDKFIARGMHEYDRSLKRNLLIGIYGIPLAAFIILFLIAEYG
jgi:hypothetical protein